MWTRLYTYDIESYPNYFAMGLVHMETNTRWLYEISDRVNHGRQLVDMLKALQVAQCRMIGFNNEGYDYPVIHHMWNVYHNLGYVTAEHAYAKTCEIIGGSWNDRFRHNVWPRDRVVPQIDLFKIMHFDNFARSTGLKKLEIAMRSASVQDLPFPPGTELTHDQMDVTTRYMCHDVAETAKFARIAEEQIRFRDTLTEKHGRDFTNYNDTKIGKEYFISELEKNGVECFEHVNGRRTPRQTPRVNGIRVADVLLPITFENPELTKMWTYFNSVTIPVDQTKGFFKDLTATVNGFDFDFGAGGIHGSVHGKTFRADDEYEIVDVDVVSYYPSLAIANRWHPEHMSEAFCYIYTELKRQRVSHAKGTPENAMLKLSLNGVYGDSNNKYSPFFDPAYTMAVTINGQLLLCLLAEKVMKISDVTMIQINTDGLSVRIPRDRRDDLAAVCRWWEGVTRLELETVEYSAMFIRDVNNYIAVDLNGKVKSKNAYMIKPDWHQDHSSMVIPKAVNAALIDGIDPTTFIYGHTDPFDFMRHVKVPKSSRLTHGEKTVQNTSRYHIALRGAPLTKIMPPLVGSDDERHIGIDVGWNVSICNDANDFDWKNLNRRFYINEAEKLIIAVGG